MIQVPSLRLICCPLPIEAGHLSLRYTPDVPDPIFLCFSAEHNTGYCKSQLIHV